MGGGRGRRKTEVVDGDSFRDAVGFRVWLLALTTVDPSRAVSFNSWHASSYDAEGLQPAMMNECYMLLNKDHSGVIVYACGLLTGCAMCIKYNRDE